MLGAGHFVLLLGVGVAVGLLFDHLARPSWLSRQIAGTNRMRVRARWSASPERSSAISSRC